MCPKQSVKTGDSDQHMSTCVLKALCEDRRHVCDTSACVHVSKAVCTDRQHFAVWVAHVCMRRVVIALHLSAVSVLLTT